MNKIHNIIWSAAHNAWVVVAEGTKSRSKSGAKALKVMIALLLISPAGAMAASLPQGGVISVGEGSIVSSGNNQLIIKQTTEKLGVNWQSFNVGDDGHVIFDQPGKNSIALNRVIGSDGSAILGKIDANGQVFLINPNGVIFGKGSQVNVGGIVASTLDITDENFKNGNYEFKTGVTNGEVVNHGTLQAAEGGYVALLGKSVKNNGIIKAKLGTAALAAGSAVTVDFAGDGLVNIQVTESAVNALVDNKGLIKADGGNVLMTARATNALTQTVVNNDGIIEAQTLGARGGKIFLDGGQDDGAVRVAGTLDASAPLSGDGGFIETSGKTVKIDDGTVITTKSQQGHSGTWLVDPTDFTISAGSGSQTSSGIGAATLVTALGSGNVTLQTAAGGTENGDINVNADVAWDSDNTLTLTAANSINVNANINIFGSSNGGLVMNFTTPNYFIAKGSEITLSSSGAPTYTENGHAFFLMKSLTDLLQLDNAAKSGGYFALATSLDASATSGWNGGLGYAPALMGSTFQGTINGLGNSITNLSINRPTQSNVGLIGQSTNANIYNLAVAGTVSGKGSVGLITGFAMGGVLYNVNGSGSVTGNNNYTGGLVGYMNSGTLTNSYSQVVVSGTGYAGGIIGYVNNSSNISTVYSTGNVTGTGNYTGGLVGQLIGSTLTNGYSLGSVSGTSYQGGIVGSAATNAIISNVYSTGNVTSIGGFTGGLAGEITASTLTDGYSQGMIKGVLSVGGVVGTLTNHSTTSNVYATGNVTGTGNNTGGLAGYISDSTLTNGYALGSVSGATHVGGAVGRSLTSAISFLYATGNVTGTTSNTGGLVGQITGGTLTNSYSNSTVFGVANVGGVLGSETTNASIWNVYSTGNVTGTGSNTGGLVGYLDSSTLTNSYSQSEVSGTIGVGGAIGRAISNANISNIFSTGIVTGSDIYVGGLAGQVDTSIISNSYATGAVSGPSFVGGLVGLINNVTISNVYSTGLVTTPGIAGGLIATGSGTNTISEAYWDTTLSGQTTSDLGVGYASLTNPLIFSNWDIAHQGGSSNIWRMYDGFTGPLLRVFMGSATSGSGSSSSITYNGQNQLASDDNTPTLTTDTTTGFFQPKANQNTWSFTQNGVAIRNAGSYVIDGWYSTQFGYDIIEPVKSTLLIDKATLNISAVGQDKTYDGTTAATEATLSDNRIGSDELLVSSTSTAFADKNAGTGKSLIVSGINVTGADAGNYTWATQVSTIANIDKANLIVGATADDKSYDGTNVALVLLSDNRITGDDVIARSGSSTFSDKNVGTGKTVTVSGISLSGADAHNYTVNATASTSASIDKASLVIKAEDSSKLEGTADGSLSWHLQGGTLFSGDSVSGALARAAGEGVGAYAIDQGDLTAGSNYDLSVVPATFTITQAVTPPVVIPPVVQPTNPQIVALVSAKNLIATVSMSAKTTDHTSNNTSFTEKNNVLMDDIMVNKGMKLPVELIDEKDSDR